MAQPVTFSAVVDWVDRHDADTASCRLRAQKRLPRFSPGQFVHLTLEEYDPSGFWPESRVFSVANAVADRQTIDLTISRQGEYTGRILDSLTPGSIVWGKGPYGDFKVGGRNGFQHAVLIAGGTGITPFASFMDAALAGGVLPVESATLYYGARTPDLLIYRPLAERCTAEISGFSAHCFVEQNTNQEDRDIRPGRLCLETILAETPHVEATAFYLSGPKPMIDTFRHRLTEEHGLSPDQVLIDAWE